MKKLLLLLVLILLPLVAMADDSGSCGPNVTYTYVSSTNTLTIQGSGVMNDYNNSNDVPWYSYRSNIKTVVIENGVTSIGNSAFDYCSDLTSVTIPNSVTSISHFAFFGCKRLTSIEIPNSVTSIGNNAFYGCTGLTSVTIGNSVTSISHLAFYGCSGLTSIEIPNSVTSIGQEAFYGCTGLTSVTIPNSVTSIGQEAFYGCRGLTSIEIPNSVKSLDTHAFSGCTGLTSVTIGYGIRTIGSNAFNNCVKLTDVYCKAESVPRTESDAFSEVNIENVTLHVPASAVDRYKTTAPWSGFKKVVAGDASGMCGPKVTYTYVSSTNTLTIQGSGVMEDYTYNRNVPWYSYRSDIKTVVIENDVTSIGRSAFEDCSGLTSVTIGNRVKSIGQEAFYGCSGLTSIEIPNSVTSIANSAFYGCSGLTSVTIGNSVTSIGNSAFEDCTSLTSVEIPNSVTSIGNSTFEDCTSLTSVEIPNSVTSIGQEAFYGCSGLTSIEIPNSVTSIGNSAFNGCSGLTSVTIGNSVTSIGGRAFFYCTGLTSVTIGNSVTSIGQEAFEGCRGLTSIEIPNSVTSIGRSAFSGCSGLTSVEIGDGIKTIGNYAFGYCTNLTDVYCSAKSVPTTESYAFFGVNIENVTLHIPGSAVNLYKTTAPWSGFKGIVAGGLCGPNVTYTYVSFTNTLTIQGSGVMNDYNNSSDLPWYSYRSDINTVVIENGVTSIGNYAFEGYSGLTSVTIGNSVTSIGERAFDGCSKLASITIPNSVTSIGNSAFDDCTSLTSIEIPNSVTSIGQEAFEGCTGLTSVTIGNSVKSIGDYAFARCSGLTSIEIPNSVTSIGDDAFYGCTGLTSIEIPNSVTSIGNYAFNGCTGLTSVNITDLEAWCKMSFANETSNPLYYAHHLLLNGTEIKDLVIPNSVTSIGVRAFYGCSGLTSVEIGDGIKTIGKYAFGYCTNLTDVYCSAKSVPTTESNAFIGVNIENVTLHVPGSAVDLYKTTAPWSGFKKVVAAYDSGMCGPNVTYTYVSSTNTLTIQGSGVMNDYYYNNNTPWYSYRSDINTVVIENGVTNIGEYTFYGCNGLTSVVIPNSVTTIGYDAFYGCSGLTSIEIPNSVTSIGQSAFADCTSLTSIEIPSSVTSIGYYAFSGCSGLTSVNITDLEAWCKMSFAYETSNPLYYAHHLLLNGTEIKDLVIPNSVTSIGQSAFNGCSGLTSIEIPNSVTSIGNSAFNGCSGLTSVIVNIKTPLFINSNTFSNRTNATLYVPVGCRAAYMTANGWMEFKTILESDSSPKIVFADANVKAICVANWDTSGDGELGEAEAAAVTTIETVFKNNTDITSFDELRYFTGLTTFVQDAFSGCNSLTSVTIPNSVTSIGNSAFNGCSGLTSIEIPNSVTSIGNSAFNGCSGLTSIEIPNSVTSIGQSAFSGCTGLTSVTIGNSVKSIGQSAFSGCTGLTSVTIGNSVTRTSIGNSAFSGCSGLTSIEIPNSVTSIGRSAFSGCSGLTSITIPSSVTSIGDYVFSGCSSLASVTLNSNSIVSAKRYESTSLKFIIGSQVKEYIIGESVTSIGQYAFSGCTGLTSVTIGNSVTSIDYSAFRNCSDLTSVTIGNQVTSIGGFVFSKCSKLTSITIPNSVTNIGSGAFEGCSGLTSIEIPNSVTSIGSSAFYNCSSLTSITIPNSVTSIGERAFNQCSGLISVTIPNSVTSIDYYAFDGCSGLTSVNITDLEAWCKMSFANQTSNPLYYAHHLLLNGTEIKDLVIPNSVTSIGSSAFYNCSSLTSITIPNSVTSIGQSAFSGCSGLTSIIIPNSVASIGNSAFSGCSGLTQVTINSNAIVSTSSSFKDIFGTQVKEYILGNEVQSIGEYTFYYCSDLTSIDIPNSVTSIGNSAFSYCKGLTSITIPNSVASIGDGAFSGCSGLTLVYVLAKTPPTAGNNAFPTNNHTITLYVPRGRKAAYETANVWKNFGNIVEFGIAVTANDLTMVYGDAVPELTYKTEGGSVTGTPQITCEATSTSPVGTYPIVISKGTIDSDEVTYVDGTLTIKKAPLTITAKSYTIEQGDALPTFEAEYAGFKNNETSAVLTSQPRITTTATSASAPGTYEIVVSGASATNYDISYVKGTLTITPSAESVTVTAKSYSRMYGEANPTFEYTTAGASLSGTPTITCDATATSPVGEYEIVVSKGTVTNKYVTYENGKLTITKAPLTITAKSYTIRYGSAMPTFEAEYSGFKNNETNSVLTTQPAIRTTATSASVPGTYEIVVSGAEATNYDITYVNGTLTIEGGINGIFYEFNGDKAIVVASPYKYQGNVVIPASVNYNGKEYSVSSIGSKAFYDCSDLLSITIPNSLTSIGDGAFNGCSGLTQVTINSNAIVSKAYSTSSSLNQIFGSQVQEYIIGDDVTSIGDYAFYGCSGITFITIPNSVTNIGNSAFYGCSGLKSVTLNSNAVVSKSYSSDINMKSIFGDQVREYIIGDEVQSIGDYAFSGCSNLASFTIPNSVATIGVATFQGCSSLTSITIPYSVTSVGNSAFSGCSSLISVIFHCKEIGSWFSGLTSIKKIVIGDEVTNIGNNALSNCTGLTNITIPNNVKSIGNSAFYGCSGLLTVTIGNGITTLPSGVFYTGKKLMSLTIGSEVLSISQFAFQPLDPWTSDYNPIKTIWMANTPPKGYSYAEGTVNYVSNNLYSDLDSVTVYSSLSTIFEIDGVKYVPVSPSERTCEAIDCTYDESVEKINIGETVSYKGVEMTVKGVQHYTCYNNTYVTNADLSFEGYLGDHAFQNCTTMTTVMLGHKIPSIGSYAFEGCKALTGIVIPNEVTSLGGYAFQNCSSMASVKMGTGLTKINPHTFSNCSSLTDMQIGNKVETIDVYAFSGCSILPTIMIPQSVTDIQDFAFSGCTSLTNVNMEERMSDEMVLTLGSNDNHPLFADCPLDEVYIGRNISYSTESDKGYSPFYLNKSLRKVTITDRETEISINEFYKCKNLQDVTIGDGVESFGDWAFSGCSSLKNFSFGMNVETIGREAFSDCTSMESIFSRSPEPPVCGSQALDDINKWTCILTVPAGNKAAYQAADQWKEFFYIEEGEAVKKYFDISINVNEGGKVLVNNKEETKVSLKKGSEVVLQFIPNKDCSLKQVIVDGEDVTNQVVDGRYTLKEMPAHDVIITVSFEKSFISGDANGDGEVNVSDIVEIVNYIMNKPSDKFVFAAADLNGDGEVNVTDIVKVVSIIMSSGSNAPRRASVAEMVDNDQLEMTCNDNQTLSLHLQNEGSYVASQFDIVLSAGQTLESIQLNSKRMENHQVIYAKIADNRYKVVIYSLNNATYNGHNGELLNIKVAGSGDVSVEDILFITAGQMEKWFSPLRRGTTGISVTMKQSEKMDIYSTDGRLVRKQAENTDGLKKGLYIVNGRKVVVK